MSSNASNSSIEALQKSDFSEWSRLFKAYVDFYKSSIPEAQYQKTFDRLLDSDKDLYSLVLRDPGNQEKLVAFVHYFPHQTPWSEKKIMHINDLFVDPSARGQGHARNIIQQVIEVARKDGCFRVEWATKFDNPARKLYDQLGECSFVEYRVKLQDF